MLYRNISFKILTNETTIIFKGGKPNSFEARLTCTKTAKMTENCNVNYDYLVTYKCFDLLLVFQQKDNALYFY